MVQQEKAVVDNFGESPVDHEGSLRLEPLWTAEKRVKLKRESKRFTFPCFLKKKSKLISLLKFLLQIPRSTGALAGWQVISNGRGRPECAHEGGDFYQISRDSNSPRSYSLNCWCHSKLWKLKSKIRLYSFSGIGPIFLSTYALFDLPVIQIQRFYCKL